MKLGIIGAMEMEIEDLKAQLESGQQQIVAGMDFFEGSISGVKLVIAHCKVGKVNAALCSQILISHFGVSHIINTGVAGSLDPRINIGDLVVSTDAIHHDMDVANLGYALGQVPGMDTLSFPADKNLAALLKETVEELAPEKGVFLGRVASGDQFVRTDEQKSFIKSNFDALCTEMEGAAIAHTCYLNGIPYVIIRAISDKADGSDAMDYPVFEAQAAKLCAQLTLGAIRKLATNFAA